MESKVKKCETGAGGGDYLRMERRRYPSGQTSSPYLLTFFYLHFIQMMPAPLKCLTPLRHET